jgi:hypothetical protein
MTRGKYHKVARQCVHCGKEFLGTARAKYCCRSHSVLATRKRLGQVPMWELVKQLKAENAQLRAELEEFRKSTKPVSVVVGPIKSGSLNGGVISLSDFLNSQ